MQRMHRCSQLLSWLQLCGIMWFLTFVCTLTAVGGAPTQLTQGATGNLTVAVVPQNVTNPTADPVTSMLKPNGTSAETLEDFRGNRLVGEGDILISEDRNAVSNLWLDAIMPYAISSELANRESHILDAFKMISDASCIRFEPHTTQLNYIELSEGRGCASFVGCQGGAQPVYMTDECSTGNLCHEILHALGLHHEHTRRDRDQYVSVQWENIAPGKKGNFKIVSGETLNLPYDLESIMHYGKNYFSKDGSPTMLPKQSAPLLGQRKRLSQLDIKRLNLLYHCDDRTQEQ
uniref:Metalloendopeptidase n=1 Tax=Gasterosteus aculeatus aculeatus TaxID=481459 RepID=G3NRE0_GASAC|nr:high choriolytic enzyme 1-like [Gasterosteus aculeatus aculeatus]